MTIQTVGIEAAEFFKKGRDRFVDEAKRLAKFRVLPGIVMVSDFLAENGTAYIVMEFVLGQTLKSYLAQMGGRLPPDRVFEMLAPIFGALGIIHETGMIHRDISPDNIMVCPDGSVKLLDFGAAREFGGENKSLSVMLKHGYAPMEQYTTKGIQGPSSDIYALSATIYRAITGITPEGAMDRIIEDSLEPPGSLGIALTTGQETALMKGLAVRQQDRFHTITELYAALYTVANVPKSTVDIGRESKDSSGISSNRIISDQQKEKSVSNPARNIINPGIKKLDIIERILKGETRNLLLGKYRWRVLRKTPGMVLLITENVVNLKPYNFKSGAVTWEKCSLREYLNTEFLDSCFLNKTSYLIETQLENSNNLYKNSRGGRDTSDYVFILSLSEAETYFNNHNVFKKNFTTNNSFISNEFDKDRVAKHPWWLRTPGDSSKYAACVRSDGRIDLIGELVNSYDIGIRPAVWIKLNKTII